jgi:membrane-associated phospholipid phosphatase
LKAILFLAINTIFWTFYQFLSRQPFFPLCAVPVTGLDGAVPFQPGFWAWVYLSQFFFTGTLPLFLTTREDIRRYAVSLTVMCLASFVIFFLFPTQGPRPAEVGGSLAMQFIASADGPLNALPSLHAAFVVCVTCLARRLFGPKVLPAAVIWGGAILYSTLATKQHYALDLLAGGALGWLADWLAWRGASAAAMIPVSTGVASQRGER